MSEEAERYPTRSDAQAEQWDARGIRKLRGALGDSQQAFAERLGTRQQTVSEWERGASRPGRMARRLLHLVAETHGVYDVGVSGNHSVYDAGDSEQALPPEGHGS